MNKSVFRGLDSSQTQFQKILQQFQEYGFAPSSIWEAFRNTAGNQDLMLQELFKMQEQNNQVNMKMSKLNSQQEQQQIKDAIQLSLQQQNSQDLLNPQDCLRQNDLPSGLSNLGMTCYFNVVIQTLYQIREVRDLILRMDFDHLPENISPKKEQQIKLLKELQVLFAQMLKGKKSFQAPSKLFQQFQKLNSNVFQIGEQADFFEFQNICFELLEQAFDFREVQPNGNKNLDENIILQDDEFQKEQKQDMQSSKLAQSILNSNQDYNNPITDLFFGQSQEIMQFQTQDENEDITKYTDQVLGIINLEVKYGELLSAFEHSQQMIIDEYTTKDGIKTSAKIEAKIKKSPQILNFYINRMSFNKKTFEPEKNQQQFKFSKDIYIDHFMLDDNKSNSQSQKEHQKLIELDRKIKKVQAILDNWEQYGENNLKLEHCVSNVIEFLSKQTKNEDDFVNIDDFELGIDQLSGQVGLLCDKQELNKTLNILNLYQKQISVKKQNFEKQLQDLKLERQKLYESQKNQHYQLFSILMHDGVANSGHYYCYIFDDKKQCWWKFNDRKVTVEKEDVIFKEAFGADNSKTNACCLFYRNVKKMQQYDKPISLSARLKKEIQIQDQQFIQQLDQDKVHKHLENLRVQMDKKISMKKQQIDQKQQGFFEKYGDFNIFLLSEKKYEHLGFWSLFNEEVQNIDKEALKNQLLEPQNLEKGIQSFYQDKCPLLYKFNSQKLSQQDEQTFQMLYNFHSKLKNTFYNLNFNILENINNIDSHYQCLFNTCQIKQKLLNIDQSLLQNTNMGSNYKNYIDYLIKLLLLKGCFVIDVNLQRQNQDQIVDLCKLIQTSVMAYFPNEKIFIEQIINNLSQTISNSQVKKKQEVLEITQKLTTHYKKIKPKNIIGLDINFINKEYSYCNFDDVKIKDDEFYKQIQGNFSNSQDNLKLWRSHWNYINQQQKVLDQIKRLNEEELLYFEV